PVVALREATVFTPFSVWLPDETVVSVPAAMTESGPSVIDAAFSVTLPSVRIAVPRPGPVLFSAIVPPDVIAMSPPAMFDAVEPMRDPALATVPGFSVTLPPTFIVIVVG